MSLTNAYIVSTTSAERKMNDYYPTSPLAVHCLFDVFGDVIPKKIWEPAAGRGWISQTMQSHGREVVSSDLVAYENSLVDIETGVDYLTAKPLAKAVITNPPYKNKLAQRFVEKSVVECDFTAMFLRLTFMESKGRFEMFKKHPPNVLVFSGRMNCEEDKFGTTKGEMGGMVAYAWFVWGKDIIPNQINWVDPIAVANKHHASLENHFE